MLLQNYEFQNEFQRLNNYTDIIQVRRTFPSLRKVNTLKYNKKATEEGAFYVLVKASLLDDIQKSMKYGVWTSSMENNNMLNAIYT